ncbi:MAG: acetate--CoA ligase alpha subunit [Promethearchaeota archaeon]
MKRKLLFFFEPNCVAVIGASGTKGKVGYSIMDNLISSGYKGEIIPVNRKRDSIMGFRCYKSILEFERPIDIAVICIPARYVVQTVKECSEKKVKGVIIISAGFKEVGGMGAIYELELQKISKKNNIRIIGPNCLGIIGKNINTSFANRNPKKGHIAIISQSGAMLTSILDWADQQEIGFSNCISFGNKTDLDEVDFIEELAEDPETDIILAYLESINDGKKFLKVVPGVTRKKPVIIIKAGTSEAGSRAASSHTGALAGNDIAFSIVLEKCGVIRAHTIRELFNIAKIFDETNLPNGNNFGIVTNAGGPGIIATDSFENYNLGLTRFSHDIISELQENLPKEAAVYNPVDIVGDATPNRFQTALEIILKEQDNICTGALIIVSPQAQTQPEEIADILVSIQKKYPTKLLVTVFMGGTSMIEPRKKLKNTSIPTYAFPEPAIKSMKYMTIYTEIKKHPDINTKKVPRFRISTDRVDEIFTMVRKDDRIILLASETSEIFRIYGIKNPKTLLVKSVKEIEEKTIKIGYPLVMKLVSPEIIHKSDIGGVILNIKNEQQAKDAFHKIIYNANKFGPKNARIYGVELQEMIQTEQYKKNTELIIGIAKDPQWGPLLMVGSGGIYANFMKDVAFDLTYKYTREDARIQLAKTRVYNILKGVRGEPPSDIEAVLDVMIRVAQLVHDFPDIVELDINPLLVFEESSAHDAYSAVDIKITISKKELQKKKIA